MWLESIQATLRRKTNKLWTDKRRNVMRQLVMERGWVQKRVYDTGWSDVQKCRGCDNEVGTEKHSLSHCPKWRAVNQVLEGLGKLEQWAKKTSKEDWPWQGGLTSYPLSGDTWRKSQLSIKEWKSESTRAGACQSKASGAMLPPTSLCYEFQAGVSACGSSVVQLDHDEKMGASAWDVRYLGCWS